LAEIERIPRRWRETVGGVPAATLGRTLRRALLLIITTAACGGGAAAVDVDTQSCDWLGFSASLTNHGDVTLDVDIEVEYLDGDGTALDHEVVTFESIRPGRRTQVEHTTTINTVAAGVDPGEITCTLKVGGTRAS
jgi:hypothetical protein